MVAAISLEELVIKLADWVILLDTPPAMMMAMAAETPLKTTAANNNVQNNPSKDISAPFICSLSKPAFLTN